MAELTKPTAVTGDQPVAADAGWGLVVRFDCKATTLHGVVALEFAGNPSTLQQATATVSPVARHLSEINLNRTWADIICLIVKNNLEPHNLSTDMMESLTGALRAAADRAWCEALRAMGEARQPEAIQAMLARVFATIIEVEFELKTVYFPSLAVTGGTAEQTLAIIPVSDPARGVMVGSLKAGDEIYVKIADDSQLGKMVRPQLGAEDEAGNPRAVARPFRELHDLGERGNCLLRVELVPGVVGEAEVYSAVKVKTARSVLLAASGVSAAPNVRPAPAAGRESYPAGSPWATVLYALVGVLAVVAAWLLFRLVTGG